MDQVIGFWGHAAENPDAVAVVEPDGTEHSAGALLAAANQVVHGLRAQGLERGDVLACVLENSAVPLELFMAAAQAGWFLTPINTHLATPEIAYIVEDCGAKAVFISPRTAEVAAGAVHHVSAEGRFAAGPVDGFRDYAAWKADQPHTTPGDRSAGGPMTYTSGTTGRPKGVRRASYHVPPEAVSTPQAMFLALFGIVPGSPGVHLTVAPLYHTAVLNFATNHLHLGHTVVLMDKWTPEGTLARISRYGVTCSHMVPTQLIRLLKLDDETKSRFDVSSLQCMIHSAAPCPVPVKQAMLDWWGPVLYEYYAASEGGGTLATPQDWLARPGTVGKPWPISQIRVLDDDKQPVPAGTPGTVWLRMGEHTFEYHQDQVKTDQAWSEGFFTVGDAGYLDDAGFLYLCDRKADMIISGGVNIYPAEIESVLVQHPKVADVAVFGVPDDEWGESVKAVVEPALGLAAGDVLRDELLGWCQGQLARYKQPRSLDFVQALPRDPNGKLYKRKLRDPYWEGRDRAI